MLDLIQSVDKVCGQRGGKTERKLFDLLFLRGH